MRFDLFDQRPRSMGYYWLILVFLLACWGWASRWDYQDRMVQDCAQTRDKSHHYMEYDPYGDKCVSRREH